MPPPAQGFAPRLVVGAALRSQSDRRLVKLVREGYDAAFEEIVRRYGTSLGSYASAIVGGRAEDVTQDSFSKALFALRRDDVEIELRPWLYRIVRNTALNDLRDRPPAAEALAEAIASGRSAAEEAEQREELAELIERLRALPEPQRAAIVMRELEGLSHEEIAAALGLSGGAARQTIYRARQALRDGLGMLLPVPLLKLLLAAAAPATAEAAAGAVGIGSAAGVGVTLKATAATVLVAGAVGAGVALEGDPRTSKATATPRAGQEESARAASSAARADADQASVIGRDTDLGEEGEHGKSGGESEDGGDSSGPGGGDFDHGRSGSGSRDDEGRESGQSGPERSGHREGGSESEDELEAERSGSDHDDFGDDDFDSSGPGSGGEVDEVEQEDDDEVELDNSGPGSADSSDGEECEDTSCTGA